MPRTSHAISSPSSSRPSRLRRMSSWASTVGQRAPSWRRPASGRPASRSSSKRAGADAERRGRRPVGAEDALGELEVGLRLAGRAHPARGLEPAVARGGDRLEHRLGGRAGRRPGRPCRVEVFRKSAPASSARAAASRTIAGDAERAALEDRLERHGGAERLAARAPTRRPMAAASPPRCACQGTTTSTSPAPAAAAAAASAAARAGSSSPAGKLATAAMRTPVPASGPTARGTHSGYRQTAATAPGGRHGARDERVDRLGLVGPLEAGEVDQREQSRGSAHSRSHRPLEQPGQVARGAAGVAQRLLVGDRLVGQALGEVGDRRDRRHAQAAVARDDRLVDGRHADGVGAERAEGADLGGRLEARAADREVDALAERDARGRRPRRAAPRAARGRRRRAGWGSAGRARRRWARRAGWRR